MLFSAQAFLHPDRRLFTFGGIMREHRTPWILWPFVAIWKLLALILGLTGRLVAGILGLGFMLVGVIFMLTVIGVPAGVALFIAGLLLLARSLF